jgi:hypothetical protein
MQRLLLTILAVCAVNASILRIESLNLPSNLTQGLAVQSIVADVSTEWPSLSVALGPPSTYASQTTPQTTLIVRVNNCSGSWGADAATPLKVATMGPITHTYGLSWPPMSAGCSGLASTSNKCKFVALIGGADSGRFGGSVTVLNVTDPSTPRVLCNNVLSNSGTLAVTYPFAMVNVQSDSSPTAIYFWNLTLPFTNDATPQLFAFDLRTCKVSSFGSPIVGGIGYFIVSMTTDPAPVGLLLSNGTRATSTGYALLASLSALDSIFVQLAYTNDGPSWDSPPPPLVISSARHLTKRPQGSSVLALVDETCADWPPSPRRGYCQGTMATQRLVSWDNSYSGTFWSYRLRSEFNFTSSFSLGNWVRWRIINIANPASGGGVLVLSSAPRDGGMQGVLPTVSFLAHGVDGELYLDSSLDLGANPTAPSMVSAPVQVVTSTFQVLKGADGVFESIYSGFVVGSEYGLSPVNITRFVFRNW